MNKRKQLLMGLLIMLTIASCRKDERTEVSLPQQTATTQPQLKKTAKPFSGSMTTVPSTSTSLNCNCGTLVDLGTSTGSGNFSHMGNTTAKLRPCVSFTQTGFNVGSQCGYLTAANGDDLYTNINPYTLTFNPVTMTFDGVLHIDFAGGTGRFSDATGSFDASLSVDLANNGALNVISGSIVY